MPSGFQQDQNQLTPSYYRVVIQCGGNSAEWYAVGGGNETGTNEGRISPYSADACDSLPATLEVSRALARGNLRFQSIVEAVENLADCQILDIETNANLNPENQADNNQIAFTIKFDRDEGVFPAYCAIRKQESASSSGTTNPEDWEGIAYPQYYLYCNNGSTANNTQDALRDIIWKALAQGRTRSVRVFHPLVDSDPLVGSGYQETLTADQPFDDGPNAYSDIDVHPMDGTTTTLTSNDDAE